MKSREQIIGVLGDLFHHAKVATGESLENQAVARWIESRLSRKAESYIGNRLDHLSAEELKIALEELIPRKLEEKEGDSEDKPKAKKRGRPRKSE